MELPSIQAANDSNSPLLSLPVELVTKIYSLLPSFFDVLALAATCRRLRCIWTTNVTSIYSQVASRSIPCERYARRFLADQGGPATGFPTLSTRDALNIVRSSCIIEKAILQFERDIVCRVRTKGYPYDDLERYYGPGARRHPPSLTQAERLRFTRYYYQLWGMMQLDPDKWQSRLESMTLKQLYLLHEISKIWQSIGREEVGPVHRAPHLVFYYISNTRVALKERIWQQLEHIYWRIHNRGPELVCAYDLEEGAYGFVVMWDHWQGALKQVVCGLRPVDPCTRPAFVKQYLWGDSSDEEL